MSTGTIPCDVHGCGKKFKSMRGRMMHRKNAHPNAPPFYKCKVSGCKNAYYERSDLLAHVAEMHSKYACAECGEKFHKSENRNKHVLREHTPYSELMLQAADLKIGENYCEKLYYCVERDHSIFKVGATSLKMSERIQLAKRDKTNLLLLKCWILDERFKDHLVRDTLENEVNHKVTKLGFENWNKKSEHYKFSNYDLERDLVMAAIEEVISNFQPPVVSSSSQPPVIIAGKQTKPKRKLSSDSKHVAQRLKYANDPVERAKYKTNRENIRKLNLPCIYCFVNTDGIFKVGETLRVLHRRLNTLNSLTSFSQFQLAKQFKLPKQYEELSERRKVENAVLKAVGDEFPHVNNFREHFFCNNQERFLQIMEQTIQPFLSTTSLPMLVESPNLDE